MKITVWLWLQEEKLLVKEKLAEKEEKLLVRKKAALNAKEDDRFVKNLQSSRRLAICIPFSKLFFKN